MSNPFVSVCISVHNTADYLPRCLDSVISQTLKQLEIILVNNGSTDNSEEIMRRYLKSYPERNIVIVSQEDLGLAQGRQSGIDHASGEFITFLDADDFIQPDAYEKLYRCVISNNADIAEMETVRDGKVISSPYRGVVSSHAVLKAYLDTANIPTMLWLRMYRRELFQKPVLPKLYTNNEDNFALPCLLYSAEKICYIKEPLHCYSTDNENAVMAVFMRKQQTVKYYENRKKTLSIISHVSSFIGKEVIESEFKNEFDQFKFRIITGFFFADMPNVPYSKRMSDVLIILPEYTEIDLLRFMKTTARRNCITNKLIKTLGLKAAFTLYTIKEKMKRRSF